MSCLNKFPVDEPSIVPAHYKLRLKLDADVWWSAAWLMVNTIALVAWLLMYWIAGPRLLGESLYKKLDILNIDLTAYGFSAG